MLADFAANSEPDALRGILIAVGAVALGVWAVRPLFFATARRRMTDEQMAEISDRNGPLRNVLLASRVAGWVLLGVVALAVLHAVF